MVSVIIPTYNRADSIYKSAKSVLDQTYSDIELIIVDDCSSDNTEQVVTNIADQRIRYIKHETNKGACAARNTGIDNAKGEYVAFQDSDDIWPPEKLEIQLKVLLEYDADICFCGMHRHNFPQEKAEYYPVLPTGVVDYRNLLLKNLVSTQTILARKDIVDKYKFDPELKRMQDYDWMIRAGEHSIVVFASDTLVDVYLQANSITTADPKKLLDVYERFLLKYTMLFERYHEFEAMLLERIANCKIRLKINAKNEYKQVFLINRTPKNFLKWIAAEIGALGWIKNLRGKGKGKA